MNVFVCIVFLQSIKEFQSEEHLQILEEEAALNITENDKSLYICDPFTGVVFNHLKKVRYTSTYASYILSFLGGLTVVLRLHIFSSRTEYSSMQYSQ